MHILPVKLFYLILLAILVKMEVASVPGRQELAKIHYHSRKKFLVPAVKSIGKDLIANTLPELVEVVSKKNFPKQAAKSTIRKTIKKQIGGSKK